MRTCSSSVSSPPEPGPLRPRERLLPPPPAAGMGVSSVVATTTSDICLLSSRHFGQEGLARSTTARCSCSRACSTVLTSCSIVDTFRTGSNCRENARLFSFSCFRLVVTSLAGQTCRFCMKMMRNKDVFRTIEQTRRCSLSEDSSLPDPAPPPPRSARPLPLLEPPRSPPLFDEGVLPPLSSVPPPPPPPPLPPGPSCVPENGLFFELSLCLSRACVGETMTHF